MTHESGGPDAPDKRLQQAYVGHARSLDGHPDEAAWERFATGELAGAARAALADHVIRCPACADVYRTVAHLVEEAPTFDAHVPASASASVAGDGARRLPYRAGLAIAATVSLAVGGAAFYLLGPGTHVPSPAEVPITLAPASATTPTPAPTRRPYRLALGKPDVKLPSALTVVMRGPEGARAQRFLEDFGQAIAPYRDDRFADAASRLQALASAYPDTVEVWFYLGVSRLFTERPVAALEAFGRAGDGGAAGDDLPWYKAIAMERASRLDELSGVLAGLCEQSGAYQERACAAARAQEKDPRP